jgi:hypothetical protein
MLVICLYAVHELRGKSLPACFDVVLTSLVSYSSIAPLLCGKIVSLQEHRLLRAKIVCREGCTSRGSSAVAPRFCCGREFIFTFT